MKKLLTFCSSVLLYAAAIAQAPQALNYQAVVRDATGAAVPDNTPVKLRFSIHDGSAGGTVVFMDSVDTHTNAVGVVTAAVGGTSNLGTVDWSSGDKYMEVEANINGAGYTSMGNSQLLSVPYALNTASISGTANYLPMFTNASTLGNSNIYQSGSNIGIGTTSPLEPLQVVGSGFNVAEFTGNSDARILVTTPAGAHSVGVGYVSAYSAAGVYSVTADDLSLGTYNLSHRIMTLRNSNSAVGIGTSTPVTLLHIAGADSGATMRVESNVDPKRPQLELVKQGGASDWRMYVGTTSGAVHFAWGTDDFATAPNDYLVFSTTYLTPGRDNYSALGGSGARWTAVYAANGTIQTSDARDKENVRDLNYGINEVMKLHPVTFNWKDNPQWGRKIGFIAQELQPVLKEVVQVGDLKMNNELTPEERANPKPASDKYGVYYSDIIPVLTKAIQEQQHTIEQLQQRLAALEKK